MARIPYVDPETAPEAVRETLAQSPVLLNIFKTVAHAETNFRPWLRLGASILGRQSLSSKLRELAILRIAQIEKAPYEWTQHVPIAKHTGVTDAQIEALEQGLASGECFDEVETIVLRFTDEVVDNVKASDTTFAAMAKHFSPQEIVELVLAIGFYMTVARVTETLAVDIDAPAGTAVVDSLE